MLRVAADAEQQMVTIIKAVTGAIQRWAVGNPSGIAQLENSHLATGELLTAQTRPGEDHWRRVAGCITLSDQTLRILGAAFNIYQVCEQALLQLDVA